MLLLAGVLVLSYVVESFASEIRMEFYRSRLINVNCSAVYESISSDAWVSAEDITMVLHCSL